MKRRLGLALALCCAVMLAASAGFAAQTIQTGDLADGAVTEAKIADGAVTDAKISGLISSGKLDGSALDVDTVDGKHASDFAAALHGHNVSDVTGLATELAGKADNLHGHGMADVSGLQTALDGKAENAHVHDAADIISGSISVDKLAGYAGIKVVHQGPADNQNTFNDIALALQSITDNSAQTPYAILVMPGVYEVNNFYFNKPYVTLLGAGRAVTTIKAQNLYGSAIQLYAHTGMRHLSIEGQMDGVTVAGDNIEVSDCIITANSHVVRIGSGDNIRIRESELIGVDNSLLRAGIDIRGQGIDGIARQVLIENVNFHGIFYWGIVGFDMTDLADVLTLRNVVIGQEAYTGMLLETGHAVLDKVVSGNIIMQSRGGVRSILTITDSNLGNVSVYGDSTIDNSIVKGTRLEVEPGSSDPTIRIGNSRITDGLNAIDPRNLGGVKLINCYDGNYDALPNGDFVR